MHKLTRQITVALTCLIALFSANSALASTSTQTQYSLGKVITVATQPDAIGRSMRVELLNGANKGKTVSAYGSGLNSATDISLPTYRPGDTVVVSLQNAGDNSAQYAVVDHYRLPVAGVILLVVVALAIVLARWRGLGSLAGLAISLGVIGGFVIPQIRHGSNPYVITLIGSFVIATLGIYLAHGISRRTTLALISMYFTLIIVVGLTALAVRLANLNGIATEDISYLHQQLPNLNIKGVLFGGIILGAVGVLDDIVVGQAAAVDELRKANAKLGWRELYQRGLVIGREHIASLINTLVLAYVGSSILFITYAASVLNLPLWLVLNSELVVEEIVRSLVGSLALLLAVPIATLLSAYLLKHTVREAYRGISSRVRIKPSH